MFDDPELMASAIDRIRKSMRGEALDELSEIDRHGTAMASVLLHRVGMGLAANAESMALEDRKASLGGAMMSAIDTFKGSPFEDALVQGAYLAYGARCVAAGRRPIDEPTWGQLVGALVMSDEEWDEDIEHERAGG